MASAPRLSDLSLLSRAPPPARGGVCAFFACFAVFFCFLAQEELRCRRLELEVEGLTAKVAAADDHRRRLEAMLKGAKRERDEAAAVRLYCFVSVLDNLGRQASRGAGTGSGERGARSFTLSLIHI